MKKIIELLETAEAAIMCVGGEYAEERDRAINALNDALALLKTPRFYTPEEWLAETGEPWADDWAVYYRFDESEEWQVAKLSVIKSIPPLSRQRAMIICATEAGCPGVDYKGDGE